MRRRKKTKKSGIGLVTSIILLILLTLFGYQNKEDFKEFASGVLPEEYYNSYDIGEIPEYNGDSYIYINNNMPFFNDDDMSLESFENYSELDSLGRSGRAFANVSIDTMPTKERESIGMVKPSGWHTVKYDIVDGKYLYNRCHLIGYQLTGENANEKNLITCTRSMNIGAMLDFENEVASYVKSTGNHVLYRVTPIYENDNLLASGVEMEAKSVEDNGIGVSFNVYVYNVEDGIDINYENGDSKLEYEG